MNFIDAIKNRANGRATPYRPGKKMIEIPGIGTFPTLLQRMRNNKIETTFKLSGITPLFIYYVDDVKSDEYESTVMLNREMQLVSDNFLAFNDFFGLTHGEGDEELLWVCRSIEEWQYRELGIPKKPKQKMKK
ncbi:MAG: hypothetical protein E6Q24_07060 [Chitinophagaceae bacterium]|nr:MAG: hypothetical protein E6Q24_07060 [Chitinophagaceae bacterium]